MDCRHSEVSVPLYPRWGLFKVESINGVATISLRHSPILSSTMETGGTEGPDTNSNCVSSVPAPNHFPISQQQELNSDSKGGCSFCLRTEPNLEELLNFERELVMRGFHPTQQCPQQIPQQNVAFTETHNQVLQPKSAKKSNQILQPESSKKLKQYNSNSPDLQLPRSAGWCSVCQIDCKSKKAFEEHILGKKHRKVLKKRKEREINENLEKNEKQVKEGDAPQKKRKRTSNTNEQTVKCNTCDKVFITQDCFKSHLAGKKHVKQLKIMERSKVSSKVKDDSKKCEDADHIKLTSTESGLLVEDDAEKRAKLKHTGKAKDDSISTAISDQFDLKENTMLNDQDRKKKTDVSCNKHKISNQILQLESSKKLKQNNSDSPDSQLPGSSGWCSLCQIECKSKKALGEHILGKKHRKMLKKLKEGEVNENLEKNEKQVKEGDIPQKKRKRTSYTNEQTVKCSTCDKVFITQDCFESHLAGKKHVKQLKLMESSKVSSKIKDDSKKSEDADEINLISTESGLLVEDDAKKWAKLKHTGKAKDDSISTGISDKFDLNANTTLKDQDWKKKTDMSSNKHKISNQLLQPESSQKLKQDNSNSSDLQLPGSSGWCSVCQIDCKIKKALEEHVLGKKHQKMLKKLKEGEINENEEKNEKQVKEGDVPPKKRKRTSNTNGQTIKCNTCDKVFITQDCFESHLAGKKHLKQLKIMESSKFSSKVKDDSNKSEDADEIKLISTESGLLVEDDAKKRVKLKHTGEAKDDSISTAISDKFDLKENTMLKDQEWKKKTDVSSNKHKISKNASTFSKKRCKRCNAKLYVEADFEAHFSGKRHAKMLKILEISKSSLESKGDGEECGKIDSKGSGSSDFGLPTKDNADKTIEDKTIFDLKNRGNLRANNYRDVQGDDAEIEGVKIDGPDGGDNKLEVRNDKDVQRENTEIKRIVGENVCVPDGEDQNLEVEVRNDNGVQRENSEIKEIEGENIDVPDGEDNKLEVEVRDDKENIKSEFDGKKDNKMDIEEVSITDLKESETSDDGPLVKDDVYKSTKDKIILEVKDNGGLEVHGTKDGL